MFQINHIKNQKTNSNVLEISNAKNNSFAKISLNKGASIQELTIGNHSIIKEMKPIPYSKTYASSLLFPFANRIKNGTYNYKAEKFQLDINEIELNNAMHGLVYNKTFEVISENCDRNSASIKLVYIEKNLNKGFPYTYSFYVEYILTNTALTINVEVENTSSKSFPFTIGWHPYFFSSNLENSKIIFDAKKKLKLDEKCITEKVINNIHSKGFTIKNIFLDDCYVLDDNKEVVFKTPYYKLTLNSSETDSYVQLYTPPYKNAIAIEPTTGVSDSFNNGIGLKELLPQSKYIINWNLKVESNSKK